MKLNKRSNFIHAGLLACACTFSSAYAQEPILTEKKSLNVSANFGFRAGNSTVEGYTDLLVPYAISDNALVFINPRFLLGDAGSDQINVGVGARYMLKDKGILGSNLYYDRRTSQLGKSFEQLGLGFEWLGKTIDARANIYRAENKLELANSYNTFETVVATDVQQQRSQQSSTVTDAQNLGAVRAEGNGLVQDATLTDTTTTLEKVETTTTTSSTTTGRLFEQYEGTLDGWDAEIGYKLPFKMKPEVRVFAGYYDFDNPFNSANNLKGYKGRLEVKASQFLKIDAEVYEEARNGSDYFVGVRLEVPLDGRDTFKHLKQSLLGSPKQSLRERMQNEMVMRDVQVHTDISKPIENNRERTVRNKDSVKITSTSSTKTEIGAPRAGKVVTKDNITFVDSSNSGTAGSGTGTKEDPYTSIIHAVNNAGDNNTIFVCESGGGVCDFNGGAGVYDETANGSSGITLLDGQVLTSTVSGVDLEGTAYKVETANRPNIQNTAQTSSNAVINTSGANTVNRFNISAQNVNGARGIENFKNTGDVVISDNIITTYGNNNEAIFNRRNKAGVTISNNIVNHFGKKGTTILNKKTLGEVTITGNTIIANGKEITNIFNDQTKGLVTVSDNTFYTNSDSMKGISNNQTKGNVTINNNSFSNVGKNGTTIYSSETEGVVTITGNTLNDGGNDVTSIYNGSSKGEITITDNSITSLGKRAQGVINRNNESEITVSDNTINLGVLGTGIDNVFVKANININNNTIEGGKDLTGIDISSTTEGALVSITGNNIIGNGNYLVGVDNSNTLEGSLVSITGNNIIGNGSYLEGVANNSFFDTSGASVEVKNNTITLTGKESLGIIGFNWGSNTDLTVSGNIVNVTGKDSDALYLGNVIFTPTNCNDVTGNILNAPGNRSNSMLLRGTNNLTQSGTGGLEADNALLSGAVTYSGNEMFNCVQ